MEYSLLIRKLNHLDLNLYQCGTEDCKPGHYFGPAVRNFFLIHYIHSGCGKYLVGEKEYKLHRGQGFLITPGVVTYYQADYNSPWVYSWVGFTGTKAEGYLKSAGLTIETPVFTCDDDYVDNCFKNMIAARNLQSSRELNIMGHLYLFLSYLIEKNKECNLYEDKTSRKKEYVNKAIAYIEMNFSRKISIESLANRIGLDRSYLGSLFKEQLNVSIQDFITNYKMVKACELLKEEALSISDVARSVGYRDPLLFSKTFRKNIGVSPRDYRKSLKGYS